MRVSVCAPTMHSFPQKCVQLIFQLCKKVNDLLDVVIFLPCVYWSVYERRRQRDCGEEMESKGMNMGKSMRALSTTVTRLLRGYYALIRPQ